MSLFKTDIVKYKRYSNNKSSLILILTTQGLWALFVYRFSNKIYKSKLPTLLKKPLLVLALMWQKWIEITTGISIPYSVNIGESFYIGHFGNVIINSNAIIGDNCNISQGVTIGINGKGDNRGVPIIGNNVYIGSNAVLAGKIKVGDNVVVGANSFLIHNVEDNTTVLGVPAEKVSDSSSSGYI